MAQSYALKNMFLSLLHVAMAIFYFQKFWERLDKFPNILLVVQVIK